MKNNFLKFLLAGMVLLGTSINLSAKNFYAVNYSLWGSNTYCHNWGVNGTTWPGTQMSSKWSTMQVGGNDVYYCSLKDEGNTKVILSNNGSDQKGEVSFDVKFPQPTYANGSVWYSPRVAAAIWGGKQNVNGGYIYFDNSTANWNDASMQLVVGHDTYSRTYVMSTVTGTKLLYVSASMSWDDAKYIAIIGSESRFGDEKWGPNNLVNATHYSDVVNYGLSNGSTYMISMNGSANCTPISIDYQSGGYDDFHYDQKVYKVLGSSTTTTNVGTVKVSTYKLDGHGNGVTSEATIATNSSSATAKAVQTATVTLTASANSGYRFDGWAESATGTIVSTDETFTYSATEAKSYYARFSILSFDITYATNDKINSYSAKPGTGVYNSTVTVTATAVDKYVITGMNTNVAGVTPQCTSGLNTQTATFTFTMPASDVELTLVTALGKVNLNFGAGAHGSLVAKIDNVQQTTGTPINGGSLVDFTATPNPNPGYEVEGWYKESTFNTKIDASTSTTRQVKADDDVNVYVQFKESDFNITLSKGTGISDIKVDGTSQNSVTAHVDTKTGTISAEMLTGYQWSTWTVTSGSITSESAWTTNGVQINATSAGTLTATATEIPYTISVQSADENKGTVNTSSVTAKVATASTTITATPKAGYYFTGWNLPSGVTLKTGTLTGTTITVNATAEGTITANFAERWVLRGSRSDNSGDEGMPGFSTTTDVFTFAADATTGTKTVTLLPNREYKFMVYDRKVGAQRGYTTTTKLDANSWSGTMNGNMHLLMNTAGYGTYTFTVQETNNREYPRVMITNPESYQITMKPKTDHGDGCQSFTAKTREAEQDFDVSDGKYVRKDGSVTFTATPKTGYSFAGFYSDAACTNQITEGVTNNTYTTTITTATSVYAKFTENMTPVTLYIGGEGTVKVGDVTHKSGDVFNVGVHTTVTFTITPGTNYKFNGWTTSTGADFTIENNVLKGNGAGRTDGQILTANFVELDKIYFLNKKFDGQYQWTDVHVYFNAYWDDTNGAGADGRTHVHMNRIEGTDIWWAYVPSDFTGTNIAFSQEDMNNYKNFDKVYDQNSHGVYRNDFKKAHNMYIPKDNGAKHNCYYFSNGYWMKYDPTASKNVGYYLKRVSDGYQYGEFKAIDFTNDGTLTSTITISVDKNETQYIYVVSAGAENYADAATISKDQKSTVLSKYESNPSLKFTPNGTGDYTFRLIQGNGLNMSIEVVFPAENGDYRVIYNNGTKDHPSQAIQGGDKVSFFVKSGTGNFRIQQFTDGAWTNKVTSIAIPSEIAESGVYNFQLADDGSSLTYKGAYTGNYYIRTDVAGGGWHNYQGNEKNLMAKGYIFGYNNTYDYAYTNWAGPNTNVKYTVANDYSICLSDSLEQGDEVIGVDKQALGEDGANIRFMWNSKTNELKRDYIGGSNDDEKFLLIHGSDNAAAASKTKSKLYETADAASPVDSAKFHDDGNWIYSKEFYVEPGAFAALTAHFNSTTQFFHGAGNAETGAVTTYEQFVGGSGENRLKMKVIYNFKTNELVAGYIPDGETIMETINLNSDLLWIRTQQGDATPINFSSTDVQIENIRKIYGVLEFCKDSMTNLYDGATKKPLTNSSYNRINYWISFPFDVRVSDIFGVDGYGEKWVIQYYNGELRAEIGWFQETETFWEWLDLDDIMYAGKGYTLNIDPEYFDEPSDDIWKNVDSKVAFYFPSAANYNVNVIKQQEVTTKIPDHEYYRSVKFEKDPEKDHKITDSYWNIIGTPAFQPTTISTASSEKHGPKAVYVWKQGDGAGGNGYNIEETMTGFTFQPMRSYIVQYGGEVTWNSVSSIVKAQAPYAYADQKNYMVDLEFYFGEQRDHTYINLSDNATKGFKLNEDVVKMTNSGEPNIYSYAEGYDVAYNEMPMENQTVNLGVIARKNGTYTFAMPKDFSGKAILIDLESGEATDLNLSNYTVELNKGTYNNRFQLVLEVEAKAPTAIDNAKGEWSEDGKTKKLLIRDQIYLINAGRVYNATGAELR